ncbi:uncharacterized protein LOC126900658 [Daktulosphaira vitifoliae]|uniref:uncharacterized protein LOC126900658 n=1 Tax=Daktulosphaira vitifoliae TaxID=58002 RepID=UPI0021A98EFC|nr:uncharacterized protein LOC126900658 [Daktulosphaira vitifoliae]
MPLPDQKKCKEIALGIENDANFVNCIGALDGKHIRLIKPIQSGSDFYNYKHYYSIVLMAICDANYCFTFIDVGAQGKFCDSTVFKKTKFYKKLEDKELFVPPPKPLPCQSNPLPFVIVADEAFGVSQSILRPYARSNLNYKKKVFNYRLSRARRYIESTFGILSNKWRIFHRSMNTSVELSIKIVKACCILHNFVRNRDGFRFEDTLSINGFESLNDSIDVYNRSGNILRDQFANYFISEAGKVEWQDRMIH